ncbi:TetR/AcrR family transcriptional regulator [Qipengyuania atrilutea]|uniref:TetR/AcrR family transcriptional regulator n=1 Tax=Qipengyuania atrilutea TaxID=2744473 RepID=A0A850H3W1_9SPHN|nr:TetR/AcrR family transcriptional regulator [Actirhodobacter atriluteus]NVD45280.1 TetR/AcrR family transcriptional regulator [Actirhodobacter atriluteus]
MASDPEIQIKQPRTKRGQVTMRKLLDAATAEFGERGFHEASISSITSRAGVALGTFYTYFQSKDALFRALIVDLSGQIRADASAAIAGELDPLAIERRALHAFLEFASEHKEIYRIIDEAEFVDPEMYRYHYTTIAGRIAQRLRDGSKNDALRADIGEIEAWAIMGMNVFLGLRYAVWRAADDAGLDDVSRTANELLERGLSRGTSETAR